MLVCGIWTPKTGSKMAWWTSRPDHLRLKVEECEPLAEFDLCSFWGATLKSKCSALHHKRSNSYIHLEKIHQIDAGNRSGEYRP